VLFASGFLLSVLQAAVLSYMVLYAKESLDYSAVAAAGLLAIAQAGGTVSRLLWGFVSDWFFGGRRRPGLVINALVGAASYLALALSAVPAALAPVLAAVAGAAAFGYMGLYLALVAEVGGVRYAGLLTGVAVTFAWSGVLVGPPVFGLVLEASGTYQLPWLLLAVVAVGVAIALHRLQPLVQRTPATQPAR
jgi:sugar phosphate permease